MKLKTLALAFLLSCLLINTGYTATDNLSPPTLPNGMTCACPGDSLTYTCTVVGGVATVWSSICSGISVITLLHARFGDGSAPGECNSGSIVGRGVSVVNDTGVSCYISELSFNASSDLNGRTVECSRDGVATIDTDTVRIAGPLPPPTNIMATVISQFSFTVVWDLVTSNCVSIVTYEIVADSADCGTCTVNTGTPSATCTGWTPRGQNCSVRVRALQDLCGGVSGVFSVPLILLLKEPDPPVVNNIDMKIQYSQSDGLLSSIDVSFPPANLIEVAPTVSPPVDYSVQFGNDIQDFPESSCDAFICRHVFNSSLPTADEFQLVVIVSNGLGNGQSVSFPTSVPRISTDKIVSITVSVRESMANISGTLPSTFMGSTALTVNYTLMSGGEIFSETSPSVGGAGQTLTVTLTNLMVGVPYTYSAFVTHRSLLVEVTGTFSSECREEDLQGSGSSTNPMCTSGGFMGGVRIANGDTCYNGTNPNSQPPDAAQTFCDVGYELSSGSAVRTCKSDGTWSGSSAVCTELAASFPVWVIIIIVLAVVLIAGFVLGLVVGRCWRKLREGLKEKECWAISLVIVLGVVFLSSFAIGFVISCCCCCGDDEDDAPKVKKVKKSKDVEALELTQSSPEDCTLYADPNAIPHEVVPTTGVEYAVVDIGNKKKKKKQPLYQDPSSIEHETAPESGDMYAVIDKPKRKSKKQAGAPDVVPEKTEEELLEMNATPDKSRKQKSEELNYADIDVAAAGRKKNPPLSPQAQPGAPVEYASVDHTK